MSHRILLVDDEVDILEFVGYNLLKEGYELYTARDGAEALQTAARCRPHPILLDRMMPRMDGAETCRAIRRDPALRDTMVVFLSALGEEEQQLTGFGVGADDYITKPIKMKLLMSRIRAILKRVDAAADTPPEGAPEAATATEPPPRAASRSTAPATRYGATAARSASRARSSRCSSCWPPRPDSSSRAKRSTSRCGAPRWWSATAPSTSTSASCGRKSATTAS